MYTLQQLRDELLNDPALLGYAALHSAGNYSGLADAINALSGPGTAPISLSMLSRDTFLAGIRPGLLALAGLAPEVQAKWDRIISVACAADTITVDTTTLALLSAAVTDGVLTSQQAAAIGQRIGSRAEVLWGAGIAVSYGDVGAALR